HLPQRGPRRPRLQQDDDIVHPVLEERWQVVERLADELIKLVGGEHAGNQWVSGAVGQWVRLSTDLLTYCSTDDWSVGRGELAVRLGRGFGRHGRAGDELLDQATGLVVGELHRRGLHEVRRRRGERAADAAIQR